jgi:hypothetical protein
LPFTSQEEERRLYRKERRKRKLVMAGPFMALVAMAVTCKMKGRDGY